MTRRQRIGVRCWWRLGKTASMTRRCSELVGEARMLQLVSDELQTRITESMRSGRFSDQAAAIVRLFKGTAAAGSPPSRSRPPGRGGRGLDGRQCVLGRGRELPHAPGREHRGRNCGDGPQRDQRAGAFDAERTHARPGRGLPRRPSQPTGGTSQAGEGSARPGRPCRPTGLLADGPDDSSRKPRAPRRAGSIGRPPRRSRSR